MKISIAVASLNYGRFLDDCLASIADQDYQDYEVLIADGGSTDDSLQIIKRFCDRDPRFLVVSTEDSGQADAIQKAMRAARGDIMGFLNADDFLLSRDVFTAVVEAFHSYPRHGVISFVAWYVDDRGKTIKPVFHRYHPLDSLAWMKYRPQTVQPATFWRREVATEVPLQTGFHYVFDTVFFFQAYQRFSFLELAKPIAAYRLHGSNKSMTVRSGRIFELAKFEQLKFGRRSLRAGYMYAVGVLARVCESLPLVGKPISRALYLGVNALAFASFYRLPGI